MKAYVYKARDLMRDPVTITPDTKIAEALTLVLNQGIGSLVVVDESRVVGIVTKRDLLWAVKAGYDLANTSVEAIMTRNVITVTPDTDILAVVNTMLSNNISHIPVVEDGKLVGIISDHDLVDVLAVVLEHVKMSRER